MTKILLIPFFISFLSCCAWSQEYSYTHYDIADGLAGSTVYCITQDKDGFIWAGTETGVSRFDGTHFRNYTTIDGLPDVEILEIFGDSKGKVWMAPFRKSICYFYKGKIYNQENDSLLRTVRFKSNIENFAEDREGNILVQERTALHLFTVDGRVIEYDSVGNRPIHNCAAISRSNTGHFLVQIDQTVYSLADDRFTPLYSTPIIQIHPAFIAMGPSGMIWRAAPNRTAIRSFTDGKTRTFPFEKLRFRHISFAVVDDSLYYYNESSGAREYNAHTGKTRIFLPGKQVSRTFHDATGNIWFTTLGQGIYRLNSDEFRTIRLKTSQMGESSIYAISRTGDHLLVGNNFNFIFDFSLPGMQLQRSITSSDVSKNRILYINRLQNGDYLLTSDGGLYKCSPGFRMVQVSEFGLKSIFAENDDQFLLTGYWGAGRFDAHSFRMVDTLWHERSTTIYNWKDTVFIGTLNGLYAMAPNRSVVFLGGKIPVLQTRISGLAASADGTLWVATYAAGVIGYKDGQVIARLGKEQGLTSGICRTLLIYRNNLWIGTDKGLNRVRLDLPGYPVTQYTSKDGLGSDIVNSIYADGPVIYVGTSSGLSYFDETKVDRSEGLRLYLLSVFNSGKDRISDTAALRLPFTDKAIRLEFVGISYRSVGGISYRYRILGLDTAWRTTNETFLEYPTLPSGKYQFQLQATNKFGVSSSLLSLKFIVATPFWQLTWFYGLLIAAFLLLTWLITSLRIENIRMRQREKEQVNQRMMELEHTALQAQMNPHFIFNCMNSIQQYIFDQDVLAANKYIAGFSRLIRSTLQNSTKAFISLSDEISYLSGYLSLEKLRFKEKMNYSIRVDPDVNDPGIIIPPMLIQPYVENSMRHGLRHKSDGQGHILLEFRKKENRLIITVEDNGIGRKKAAKFKTSEHIEYQSRGMSLTADRIRMMNTKYGNIILVTVTDLEDTAGRSLGTRVTMEFPLFHLLLEKEDL